MYQSSPTDRTASQRKIRVYVHLARGFDAATWKARLDRGELIGINDPTPYGYHRAEALGCRVVFSQDKPENKIEKLSRLLVRGLTGFDFVHVWRNRAALFDSDVVWTHTESQSLAVLALLIFCGRPQSPKVIAQSIWLMDRWKRLLPVQRTIYKWLIGRAAVLTFLSPLNTQLARDIFPSSRVELMPFGIPMEGLVRRQNPQIHAPLRVLSAGNDRHRDWPTLIEAVRSRSDLRLQILTRQLKNDTLPENIEVFRPGTNEELLGIYDNADILVLPLVENLHASGITVLLEAVSRGLPIICSDVGGLRQLLSDSYIHFIPARSPEEILRALDDFRTHPDLWFRRIAEAQDKISRDGPSALEFARRHAELSFDVLGLEQNSRVASAASL